MIKTYTYKIKTNKQFEDKFNKWIGICNYLYNCALELKIDMYRRFGKSLTKYDIYKQLTEAKKENLWMKEVANVSLRSSLDNLDMAYQTFFKGGGFPKFKKKKYCKSIGFKSIMFNNNQFVLPKWGTIDIFKNRLPEGKLKTASIVKKADGYYLHVQAEYDYINTNENQVGIDMGIKYFAVTSDNIYYDNPQHFKQYERKLRIENRSLARKIKYSKKWYKQVNKLARLHLKISRVRLDYLHKVSTELSKLYGLIFMEDLNIKGMSKNKNLSKHILDCGWGIFKQLLSYKATVYLIDPKYTSQTCSSCGCKDSANRINQSTFICTKCGIEFNADYNASLNILGSGRTLMREREMLVCA